jgi:hypothetical protein
MNSECQTLLAQARTMLAEAKSLNENSRHGAAMKRAYDASENIAAAYLSAVIGQCLPPNDATYDLFAKTIREPSRHPASLQKIKEVVGDVCALREAYEPVLLNETISKDAEQMIGCVYGLLELIGELCTSKVVV